MVVYSFWCYSIAKRCSLKNTFSNNHLSVHRVKNKHAKIPHSHNHPPTEQLTTEKRLLPLIEDLIATKSNRGQRYTVLVRSRNEQHTPHTTRRCFSWRLTARKTADGLRSTVLCVCLCVLRWPKTINDIFKKLVLNK